MGLGSIGVPGLILILIVALLLFGPNKLPELGKAFGKTIKEFKKGAKDVFEDDDDAAKVKPQQAQVQEAQPAGQMESKQESRRLPE
ncbi:twin-arginine translocase TatA/TatE family subunit [Marinicrinis lubricantis]|uniref:Sec-independent protein translocase protein TatA n=1 Tax=Marinicrinis lubricantis TaxID=2086470 RepID=A0ABW1IRC3_9BACL